MIKQVLDDDIAKSYFVDNHYVWEGKEKSRLYVPELYDESYMIHLQSRDGKDMLIWQQDGWNKNSNWVVEVYYS